MSRRKLPAQSSVCTCGGILGDAPKWCDHCTRQSQSRLRPVVSQPVLLGIDRASGPDETAFAILSPAGMIAVKHGRDADHEAMVVPLIRARRMAEGRPPAQWVVVCWRQKQRILRHAKQLAQAGKDRLHRPFGGEPSAS